MTPIGLIVQVVFEASIRRATRLVRETVEMRPDEFFYDSEGLNEDGMIEPVFDLDLVDRLRTSSVSEGADVELAVSLALLIDDELQAYGTDSSQRMSNEDMRRALRSLRGVLMRLGVDDAGIQFRDFNTFRTFWEAEGAWGSWQARRVLVNKIFGPIHDELGRLEQQAITSALVEPISPHARTGWSDVDAEISELRRHFNAARTPQDYRNVGNDCVAVTEAISAAAYDPSAHLRSGEEVPAVDKTKQRIGRVVEDAAPGPGNAELRKVATAVIELAHHVKHSPTPTRREAGIAADSVIQLANMIRRLSQEL